ncbi:hypothetical protein [Rhizobium leguminosarum]|uniref:DUF1795 domain-containing protein n=1 Tax=Rhizobium leguminosarum TaxID=384 RepID=A0A7X0DXN7_RHILE|nr:hypothetical protein [Rhizobium leguminosarum]MBB6224547.1 hypothetical protein [Rhizobium leguminosarum]
MKFTLSMAMLLISVSGALAGPFGLEKGMKQGALDIQAPMEAGAYLLKSVPKPHDDFQMYGVTLGEQAGVCRIVAMSAEIENDRYGLALREKFEKIRSQLAQNYGSSTLYDTLGNSALYDDNSDWTMALTKHERVYSAEWKMSNSAEKSGIREIRLSLVGQSRDSGMVTLLYIFDNVDDCLREISSKGSSAL